MRRLIIIFALLISGSGVIAQPELEKYKKLYPSHEGVFIYQSNFIKITNEKGKLKIVSRHSESMMPFTSHASMLNSKSVGMNSFVTVENLQASVMVPEKSGYKTVKVTDIELKNDMDDVSFYDDSKSYNFIFPSLVPGAKTKVEYTNNYTDPHFFGSYYFGNFLATDSSDVTIEVQKGIDLCFTEFNFDKHPVAFSKKETSKSVIYKWKSLRVPKIEGESNGPNPRYYIPHVIFRICGYTQDKNYVNVLKNTDDLYSWYTELTKNTNKEISEQLKKITDSLVNGVNSEEEKVRRIFYWVQDKIAYVAIEDGLGGFVPREASVVYSRRYGDCKDMASILTSMLNHAGVKAYLTWIGTRDIPYSYTEVPSLMSDNHMIATWKNPEGKAVFLDATGKHHSFGYPTAMIQGKEALLGMGEGKYEIIKVPVVLADMNSSKEVIDVFVEGDGLKGKGKIVLTGFEKSHFLDYADHYNYKERVDYLKALYPKGSNKLMIDTMIIKDEGKELPLEINYTFSIPGHIKSNKDELYINLNLNKNFPGSVLSEDRKIDLELEHKRTKECILNFHLPAEYKMKSIPSGTSRKEDEFQYKIDYSVKGEIITISNNYEADLLMLENKNFNKWNDFIKSYIARASESIVIVKK